MRPPREQRSLLKYPLDDALGTPAMVRLLRVLLHDVRGPVSVADAARLAGLSTAGVRKAFAALERSGMAVRIGTGRAQKWAPPASGPFATLLMQLFTTEQQRYDELIRELRRSVSMPEVRTAWTAEPSGESVRTVEIDVVADSKAIDWIGSEVRSRLEDLEKRFDLTVEVNVHTRADAPDVPAHALLLWGGEDRDGPAVRSGLRDDSGTAERSLAMSKAIADLIRSDPSLIRRALHHTNRLIHEGQGMATGDIAEWRQLLETYSPERLRDLLVSRSSRAERLRRSSPFFAVLTPDERDRVVQAPEPRP
ncbi:MAG: hypothetical protein U1E29_06865 [Coriobacteriia bacterium]|nr:hypothetical protein [Coriobacteriia bacterium]